MCCVVGVVARVVCRVGYDPLTCCDVRSLMPVSGITDRDDLDTALEAARRPPRDRGVCITVVL